MRASGLALAFVLAAGGLSAAYLVVDSGYFPEIGTFLFGEAKVYPTPNWEGKADRIALTTVPAAFRFDDPANDPAGEPLRQSFAAIDALTGLRQEVKPPTLSLTPMPRPRPQRSLVRRQQSSYTLLSDLQIDAIKTRLRLTAAQEQAWPPVESALRSLASRMHDSRRSGAGMQTNADEVAQLKAAAGPFFSKLSGEQKRELKMLAHIIGLSTVVAML